ncbi:MAG: hypothetical protein IKI36_03340 [Prevotella sp.]|nr:hypothetical protein [Prevotella sp.]
MNKYANCRILFISDAKVIKKNGKKDAIPQEKLHGDRKERQENKQVPKPAQGPGTWREKDCGQPSGPQPSSSIT